MKAQGQITAFINDELNITELDKFIDHIDSCEDCKEELEVYYTLLTAMKQLDEDKNLSDDFNQELKEKLDKTQEKIIHLRYNYYRKKGVMVIILLPLTLFFGLHHYIQPKEQENPVIKSQFSLRVLFMEESFDKVTEELTNYLDNQEPDNRTE
jgi:uncharacterized membrane protein YukC